MPVDPALRHLEVDIPTQPPALVRLSLLLAEDELNMTAAAELIEGDMALAAAVMKAVNSSLYGMNGRVQSVHQAITYLGVREVAGITFELGLRAAFPPTPELEPLWERASRRGVLMGRLGQTLDIDAWAAHSAGLFEECGKAVLLRHAPERYKQMLLDAGRDDAALALAERAAFGVSHDALGAAMCESWGLASAAVASVRHHITVQVTRRIPATVAKRGVCGLSAIAAELERAAHDGEALDEVVRTIAPQAGLDTDALLLAVRRLAEQMRLARGHRLAMI